MQGHSDRQKEGTQQFCLLGQETSTLRAINPRDFREILKRAPGSKWGKMSEIRNNLREWMVRHL